MNGRDKKGEEGRRKRRRVVRRGRCKRARWSGMRAGAYGVRESERMRAGRERYKGGAVLRYDFIALSLDQE